MKKYIALITGLIVIAGIFSFKGIGVDESEITVTVTSDKPEKFDMFRDVKITKGLTTPHEFKFRKSDSKFIFKSAKAKSTLKIDVKENGKTRVQADWPIIVLLIDGEKLTTFGMD
jgi:hypothetical protein